MPGLLGLVFFCVYPYFVAYRIGGKHKNGVVTVWLLAEAVLVLAWTILYSHWFAYKSAAKHLDGQEFLPAAGAVICVLMIIQAILEIIFGNHNRRYIILIIGLAILLAGCVYAAVFTRGVECPACNSYSLNDDLYKYFWRLFTGEKWHPSG